MADNSKNQEQPIGQEASSVPPCPKDCRKCSVGHQIYCTAKMTFDSFAVMAQVIQRLDILSQRLADIEQRMADLEQKVPAIGPAGAEFSSPSPMEGDLFQTE